MKHLLSSIALIVCLLTATSSCNKDNNGLLSTKEQTIIVTLSANKSYTYDLGAFGIEEGVTINREAAHSQISSLNRNAHKIVYEYKPVLNYTGTDEVVLLSERSSNGANRGNKIIVVTIKFTITP